MPKIKLYKDEEGNLKGDCSICYNAKESVEMAVSYLDEGYIRPTHKIRVTKAEFEAKDDTTATASTSSANTKPSSSSSGPSTSAAPPSKRYKISSAQVKVAKSAMNQVRIVCIYIVCV